MKFTLTTLMKNKTLKVLFVAAECNSQWTSVPQIAYQCCKALSEKVELTLVTHIRNKNSFENSNLKIDIEYIPETHFEQCWYKISNFLSLNKKWWPVQHILTYPLYLIFSKKVSKKFRERVEKGIYDIVHVFTPILPRYPAPLADVCGENKTPLVIGPLNGGLKYPEHHLGIYLREGGFLKKLSFLSKYITDLRYSYDISSKIICGSHDTQKYIESLGTFYKRKIEWIPENGVESINPKKVFYTYPNRKLKCLFVGRLVPYKGLQFVIQAIYKMHKLGYRNITLDIIGSGEMEKGLRKLVFKYKLFEIIKFHGKLNTDHINQFYQNSDLLTFPSIREFGGAVVMEAMSNACPALVIDRGGPGEITTTESSFKLNCGSEKYIIDQIVNVMKICLENPDILRRKSSVGLRLSEKYLWENKINQFYDIYQELKNNVA